MMVKLEDPNLYVYYAMREPHHSPIKQATLNLQEVYSALAPHGIYGEVTQQELQTFGPYNMVVDEEFGLGTWNRWAVGTGQTVHSLMRDMDVAALINKFNPDEITRNPQPS
ncbi:hypothetical protein PtB15_10B357 [Puccinia triticina]|nr:hypothetical protein PtB15_10B357 [Puccinia triticina]